VSTSFSVDTILANSRGCQEGGTAGRLLQFGFLSA
jgi:hypothetical protein